MGRDEGCGGCCGWVQLPPPQPQCSAATPLLPFGPTPRMAALVYNQCANGGTHKRLLCLMVRSLFICFHVAYSLRFIHSTFIVLALHTRRVNHLSSLVRKKLN